MQSPRRCLLKPISLLFWRKNAVTKLLTVEKGQDRSVISVFRAALLRDEHYDNNAYKDAIRCTTALMLAFAMFIGFTALLVLFWTGILYQTVRNSPTAVLGIALMGYLGATFSAITTVPRPEAHTRIPEVIYSFRVTALRLLVGPVSAIIIYFAAQSDLYESVLKFERPEDYALLVLAFVAGFTERLVLRVVEAIAGKPSS